MVEALLLVLTGSLWFLLRPARDWYVVEWRFCSEDGLCSVAFPDPANIGFDKTGLRAHKLSIHTTTENVTVLGHEGGGKIIIEQAVFESLDAARLHFESLKHLLSVRGDFPPFRKLYLWKVVARSRSSAFTLPPSKNLSKDGKILVQHPEQLWLKLGSEASAQSP